MEMTVDPAPVKSAVARSISILGSTGSIGRSTLDLIDRRPEQFRVTALTGNRNVALLAAQARRYRPDLTVIGDTRLYGELKEALSGEKLNVAAGVEGLSEAADHPADLVMAGIVGVAGLKPTLAAARRGSIVALANKECLVCAGSLLLEEVERSGAELIPVDSEHNAIFQVFDFDRPETVEKIILTASGGPFRRSSANKMAAVSAAEAVDHPNWDMGAKISVDSATMMNKGLELIEAYHLFPVKEDQIDILVHPQSVVHSMVSYIDGSVLAQMGSPDMRTPISFALAWPDRISTPSPRLDLAEIGKLTFEAPDEKKFPALRIARAVLKAGGSAPTVMNAANEIAVEKFLTGQIGFLHISRIVEEVLGKIPGGSLSSIDEISEVDREARQMAEKLAGSAGTNK